MERSLGPANAVRNDKAYKNTASRLQAVVVRRGVLPEKDVTYAWRAVRAF